MACGYFPSLRLIVGHSGSFTLYSRSLWSIVAHCGSLWRCCRRILQIHKIKNNMIPSYLGDKLRPNRRLLYRCKNSNTFHEIRCNTSKYKNSFFPDAIISWNNIITNFLSFTILKAHILSLIRPKAKSTSGVHDSLGLRFLFQLLVGLNLLRNQKRRYNFADTSSGICECNQDIEDTSHFLFECPRYATQRANLAVKVIDISQRNNLSHLGNQLELYLYGHRSLNPIDNRNILSSTIEYIKDTQRGFHLKHPFLSPCYYPLSVTIVVDVLFPSYYYCFVNCKFLDCHGFGLMFLPSLWPCIFFQKKNP